ncbi:MAG: protein-disulfide reductase DsbD [Gammaproteobacteria bacterium]|nr:MAG: protein-disulfide reductase DsbD [Gammaproteobacteria bacterium]
MSFRTLQSYAWTLLLAGLLSSTAWAVSPLSALGMTALSGSEPEFLPVDEAFRFSAAQDDKGLVLNWRITEGYYLYQERIHVKPLNDAPPAGEPVFDREGELKDDPNFGQVRVFHDQLAVHVPVSSTEPVEYQVSYQGCAEAGLCYPPQKRTVAFVPGTSPEVTPTTQSSLPAEPLNTESASDLARALGGNSAWVTLLIFLGLGIGLAFTPCVFPMIPILSSIVTGQKHITTARAFALSWAYVIGMAATYAAAGVLVGVFGASANIQAYMQEPWLITLFATLFVALALSMFGFYELQLPAFLRDRLSARSNAAEGGSLSGAAAMGVFSALVVSPCVSAPLAGALVYISTTGDGVLGGLTLFTLGIGMGIPLILIAVGGKHWLPRAGGWMESVKAVFGVLLLGVAIWLLERILPAPLVLALWALLAICSAVYMGAFSNPATNWQKLWKGLGLALFVYGLMLLAGAALKAEDPLNPLEPLARGPIAGGGSGVQPVKAGFITVHSSEDLDRVLAERRGKPAFVDFYADWCISCKVVEREVFTDPQVSQMLQKVTLIKADITENDDANQALLNRFGLYGPPAYLFYNQDSQIRNDLTWIGEVDTPNLVRILKSLLGSAS